MKNKKNIILVNAVTSLRIIGIFFLIPIYLTYGGIGLAITNSLCFLTDFIDGKMARKMDASTFFGSFYDGFSDKAFVLMNFLILISFTPWALIPMALELGIVGMQYLKYKNNLNVQSNIWGKIKMWVVGLTVVLTNLLISCDMLKFLGNDLIDKIAKLSPNKIVQKSIIPLIISEAITLISYILEFAKAKKDNENLKEKPEETKTLEDKSTEEKEYNLKDMLFDHDFYLQHRDESILKLMRTRKNFKR